MLTRRPSPFLIGIVIGSLLHLMVLPWLSTTQAQSAQPFTDDSAAPPTIEYAGLKFATDDQRLAGFLLEHLRLTSELFAVEFPARGSFIGTDSLVVGMIDGLDREQAIAPGDIFRPTLDVGGVQLGAELLVLNASTIPINEMDRDRFGRLPRNDIAPFQAHILTCVLSSEAGTSFVDAFVTPSRDGHVFVPIQTVGAEAASAHAIAGAASLRDVGDGGLMHDYLLLLASDRGVEIPSWAFETDNMYERSLLPPDEREFDGLMQGLEIMIKRCERVCEDGRVLRETDPEAFSDFCECRTDTLDWYNRCVEQAKANMEGCMIAAGVVAVLGVIILAAYLGVPAPALPACIKTAVGIEIGSLVAMGACIGKQHAEIKGCKIDLEFDLRAACRAACRGNPC